MAFRFRGPGGSSLGIASAFAVVGALALAIALACGFYVDLSCGGSPTAGGSPLPVFCFAVHGPRAPSPPRAGAGLSPPGRAGASTAPEAPRPPIVAFPPVRQAGAVSAKPAKQLAAFVKCFRQRESLRVVLKSFRAFYPTSTMVMVNDAGVDMRDIALTFGAVYFPYTQNIGVGEGIEYPSPVMAWLERFFAAIAYIDAQSYAFFVIQDEDVLHARAVDFDLLKYDVNGMFEQSRLPAAATEYARRFNPGVKEPRAIYSCFGGSILRTEFFQRLGASSWREHVENFAETLRKDKAPTDGQTWLFDDVVLSFLTLVFGGVIGPHEGLVELTREGGKQKLEAGAGAIYHHYKDHYVKLNN